MGHQARISSEEFSCKYFADRVLNVYKLAIKPKKKKSLLDKLKGVFYGK